MDDYPSDCYLPYVTVGCCLITRWKNFFIGVNENNFHSTIKSICIHGYCGEELINIWNKIHQTNITLKAIF